MIKAIKKLWILLNNHKKQSKFDFKIMPVTTVHSKTYLADNRLVVYGSANFTKSGLWNQHNTITILNNFQDYKKHESIFFGLWKENKLE